MATATLNVRLPDDLKKRGMQVLEREGVSVSEIVRDLFRYMEVHQELPDFAQELECGLSDVEIERRREALRSLVGALPSDVDLGAARYERLMEKSKPGVRA